MRRKDREITDKKRIEEIIMSCEYCRLSLYDKENDEVYIVPVDFGYLEENDKRIFYFHSAKVGRKINLILERGKATIELDQSSGLIKADIACEHSRYFASIIANGNISIIEDIEKKKKGLNAIMYHNTGKNDWDFPISMINEVTVIKLEVDKLSCKEKS